MKKLTMMLALLLVVCFATGAIAEDRLSWSGAYRARGWYNENSSDFDSSDDTDRNQYIDQRFRVQMRVAIADGIDGTVRIDFGEVTWGLNTTGSRNWARPDDSTDSDAAFQLDRSYVRINKEMFTLVVGQQFMSLGKAVAWSSNQFGANLRVKLPVDLYGQYAKIDESGSRNDESANDSKDVDFWGGQAVYKQEGWSVGALGALISDQSTTDNSPYVFGIFGDATWGAFALEGAANFFGGDNGAQDVFGSQGWLGGKYTITPAFWLGLDGWYAGSTNNANKTQRTALGSGGSWEKSDLGPFNADIIPIGGVAGAVGGTGKIHPEFDPAGTDSGAIGGVLSAGYRIIEPLNATAAILYVVPESTNNTILNSVTSANIFLNYDWYENTQVAGGYVWTGIDADGVTSDAANILVIRLQLKW